jgi:HK97 family phage prohead protease
MSEILTRSDGIFAGVDAAKRLIDVIAVPWGQPARVFWRGEYWTEVFERGAFSGVHDLAGKIRVNREHRKGDTVGKVVEFDSEDQRGLLARVKVVNGPRGDELLCLAQEDMVSASIGYATRNLSKDVVLDKDNKSRLVKNAFLDHLSMVEDPAFEGARVLAVRQDGNAGVAEAPLPSTPVLDEMLKDPVIAWAMKQG